MSLPFARSRRNAPRLRYHASMLLVSPTLVTIVLRLRVYVHTPGGASCAWMPASTSGGCSASALVVEIRSSVQTVRIGYVTHVVSPDVQDR